jgi:hypothetical protein
MSRRFQRPAFEKDGPFVVRNAFLFGNRWLSSGQLFDHEKVPLGRLKGLYRQRRIDLAESVNHIKDANARPVLTHWSELDDKQVLRYAYKVTGTRRRNPDIARAELGAMEAAGELNVFDPKRAVS